MEGTDTNRAILRDLEQKAAGEIQLGLDLKGGSQFVVELKVDGLDDPEGAVNQAMNVLRKRVDRFGVAEPVIQSMGGNKIIIQIPGISQSKREEAKRNIQRVASLRFQLVDVDSQGREVEYQPGIIVPGSTNLTDKFISDDGKKVERQVMVETKVQMGGEHVTSASAARDPLSGAPVINFALDMEGAGIFQDVTSRNIGRGLAIVLVDLKEDGTEQQELVSAPTIQSAIGARGEITGIDTPSEAREIANVLENPLSTPLKIIEERDVDPSLGADSVNKGFEAAQWGIIAVAVFMLGYYLLCGLFANVALALNIVILLGVFCYFGSTLTLPGIAGIVLTIGMAVDANVLIFERIREEHRAGKSLKGAVASGYGKAFGTIFDANITTVIASLILYWKGHGPVQGFGITLTIGILTSMFTALVVTRLLFDILIDNKRLKSHPKMFAFVGDTKIDFLKYAKPAFIASWVVIIVGIGGASLTGYTGSMEKVKSYISERPSFVMKPTKETKDRITALLDEKRNELADKRELINDRFNKIEREYNKRLEVDGPETSGGARLEDELKSDREWSGLNNEITSLSTYIESRENLLKYGIRGQRHPAVKYTVAEGDSVEKIANKLKIETSALIGKNEVVDWGALKVGDKVNVPSHLALEAADYEFKTYKVIRDAMTKTEGVGQRLLSGEWGGVSGWIPSLVVDENGSVSVGEGMFDFELQFDLHANDPSFFSVCWQSLRNNIRDNMMGIDFAGGRSLVIKYDEAKKAEVRGKIPEIRKHLADKIEGIELSQVNVRLQSAMSTGDEFMRVDFPDIERQEGEVAIEKNVENELRSGFASIAKFSDERSSSEKVGASISSEIQTAAIVATILAMFGILIYVAFRYEFSFAIGAVLAIVHDVLMTAGLFFLAGMVTGIDIASGELNAPVIAAFLTIIGFSINDTIVIFDRIREALTSGTRGSFANVMNVALNQTLARTIITSGTTLLSTGTLYFFGGVVIHDFAFCLLVGVVVGTYSSIYIACAIVLWKHKGKRPELTVGDIEITPDPVSA